MNLTLADPLPPAEDRVWLVDRLAELIDETGPRPWLTGLLLEPSDRFFPDRVEGSAHAVWVLLRRLLDYAGLEDWDFVLYIDHYSTPIQAGHYGALRTVGHTGVAGWFMGQGADHLIFGVDANNLGDPEQLAGTLAHEVAHAFRYVNELETEDRDEEERLTDLTAVYLGFGVLVVNNRFRMRTSGSLPEKIAKLLETNQASYYEKALAFLQDHSSLLEKIDLPPAHLWPKPIEPSRWGKELVVPDQVAAELEAYAAAEREAALESAQPLRSWNLGKPVFRVKIQPTILFAFLGLGAGVFGAMIFALNTTSSLGPLIALAMLLAGPLFGARLARLGSRDRCSDPSCFAVLPDDVELCPQCGGTISGRIKSANDRLAKEEELRAAKKKELDERR